MTIVSPIASRPMIAAPETICCRLVTLTKFELSIPVTRITNASASRIPSSRKRKTSSASECELGASGSGDGGTGGRSSAIVMRSPGARSRGARHRHRSATTLRRKCNSTAFELQIARGGEDMSGARHRHKTVTNRPQGSRGLHVHAGGGAHDRVLVGLGAGERARDAALEE